MGESARMDLRMYRGYLELKHKKEKLYRICTYKNGPERLRISETRALGLARFCLGRVREREGGDLGIGTKDMREQPGSEGGGRRGETLGKCSRGEDEI